MKTLLFLCTLLASMGIRYLRWFALTQEKEYRPDRIWLFIRSEQGRKEFLRLIPHKTDFTRTGCKRPALTARMLLVVGFTGVICFSSLSVSFVVLSTAYLVTQLLVLGLVVMFLTVFAPLIIVLAVLPTAAVHQIVTQVKAQQAQRLFSQRQPTVIGITGSFGKTSTKLLLAHVLSQNYSVFSTPKSYNTLLSVSQSILKNFSTEEIAILEYAAYGPGEIKKLANFFQPDSAIVTGFTPQHLGLFGSIDNIIAAKSELVAALHPKDPVFFPAAQKEVLEIVQRGARQSGAVLHSVRSDDLCSDISITTQGKLRFTYKNMRVDTQLLGTHYIDNCILVWQVAKQFLSDQEIKKGIETFVPSQNFVTQVTTSAGVHIIDDGGSSNPAGFLQALKLFSEVPGKRKIVITPGIVDLGTESDKIHTTLLQKSKDVADTVVYIGDTSKEVATKVLGASGIFSIDEAKAFLSELKQGDTVLIEGRMPGWVLKTLGI